MLTPSGEAWRYKRKQDISPEALRASWRVLARKIIRSTNLAIYHKFGNIYIYIYILIGMWIMKYQNHATIFKKVSKRTWSESVNFIYKNVSKKTWFEKNISISTIMKMTATVHISAAQTQERSFNPIINSYSNYFPYTHFEAVRWSLLWKRFTIKLVLAFWY